MPSEEESLDKIEEALERMSGLVELSQSTYYLTPFEMGISEQDDWSSEGERRLIKAIAERFGIPLEELENAKATKEGPTVFKGYEDVNHHVIAVAMLKGHKAFEVGTADFFEKTASER